MKKLILLSIMLTFMVSGNLVFGQAVHNSWPMPISCENDALHPIAGKPYTYNVDVTPTGGDFQWWATKDYNFISGGANNIGTRLLVAPGELIATSANYGTTDIFDTVSITWSSEILANTDTLTNPTFVAVQYDAPATGCANNLKVYSIMPVTAFTVDILNLEADGDTLAYGVELDTCTSDIDSAIFVLATRSIQYNFGDNQLLFEVVLANFTDSAYVSFNIAGLSAAPYDQTADLAWGYSIATAGANTLGTGLGNGLVPLDAGIFTAETNTSLGVSIFVLATVHNNNFESPDPISTAFTLAVNAVDGEGNEDVENLSCVVPPVNFEDLAIQNILPRPEILDATPPAGDDFLPIAP